MATRKRRGPGRPANPIERATLLTEATRCFAERGYGGASMSFVAEACGLQKASLFYYFPTKEMLYLEVLYNVLSDLAAFVQKAATEEEGSFEDRLDQLTDAVAEYLSTHPHAARILVREFLDQGPFSTGPGQEALDGLLQVAHAFIGEGPVGGDLDVRQVVISIISVHVLFFAAPNAFERYLGGPVFSEKQIKIRRAAVRNHIRALAGLSPA
jgi:AcrR family transcriptional regulator